MDHLVEVTELLKGGSVGLMLDLDGTISEIVPHPEEATVSASMRAVLRELNRSLALVAIVTGRSARQASDIVGLQELTYSGNHGLEWLKKGRLTLTAEVSRFEPALQGLRNRLEERFSSSGLVFEDKAGSFAVHYRHVEDPEAARDHLLEAVEALGEGRVKVVLGKSVINVLPPVDLHKGTAAISLASMYALSGAILIGDDVTDIDLFRGAGTLTHEGGFCAVSIAVGGNDAPHEVEREADFTVESVSEVEEFLAWIVEQTR